MLSLWNLYLLLALPSLLSLHARVSTGENVKETQQTDTDTAVQDLIKPSQRLRKSGLAPVSPGHNPLFRSENADFLDLPLSWPSLPSEESDRQGVIGEYTDLQESTEAALVYPYEKGPFESRPTESATSGESIQPTRYSSAAVPPQPSKEQTFKYEPFDTSTGSMQTGNSQNETNDSRLPFLSSGSLPSEQDSTQLSAGPGISPENATQLIDTSSWEWMGPSVTTEGKTQGGTVPVKNPRDGFVNVTDHVLHREGVGMETGKDDSRDNGLQGSRSRSTSVLDGNMDTSTTPCKTTNQSWTPTYPDDFTPSESLPPSLALSPGLYVPLYSDWNSALATWGFAWEAHIYGLGSVFSVFSVISVMCLLGLLLRCPPGTPYFTLLHLFLLAFAGMQAFCLLYDAYSHQDRLPPLGSLMLSELPFPCLIAAFSMAFLLLLLCSHMHISLPLAISSSFSNLTKPRLFLCISLLHFGVSLGCVGLLQLFHNLPTMILLSPHCLFVCLTIFLSCSYLMFYCLIRVNTKHIYRLNDNGEAGGSPEVVRPANCPFAKAEDWHRAAGAGVGASLCLLGCGGLQLYGILYALGLGRVDDYGFQPWSWWSYQVGCRLCEIGVCLGLSLIGTHPLFCQNNTSIKTITQPRPGSWSRLSCGSPSQGLNLPSHGGADPPVLPSPNSWSQDKQEKLVVCDVVSKGQSETLLLCSMVDPPENGLDCVPKSMQIQTTIRPLPTPPSPPQRLKTAVDPQLSSLDSLAVESDSTVDLRPPSPIDLSRSIDQALFSESLFSHSIFGLPRVFHTSSSHSLSSPSQGASNQDPSSLENSLYRTSSCGVMDKQKEKSSRSSQPNGSLTSNSKTLEQWDWKESVSGSTQGLCSISRETGKLRSHSWANRGQSFTQHSLPRAIPHLSYHRRYRTLSLASQDIQGTGQLAGTKHLSESKQLEWDLAVQAEFVNVCKQIDALSVCSDTIEL